MYTQLLIPSKAKCASGNATYLGSCMTELLKTVEWKVKVQQLNSNHCFCYPSTSALHSMNQTNTTGTHNIIAQSKRHKYSIFICSYSIKVTTTKEYFSQCMLQQQSLSNTKRLLKEHSQTIIIIITGSLEMNENEKKGRDQMFMQYSEITVQTGKGIRLVWD